MRKGYTYILTNKLRTVFYTGVTSDIHRRLDEHRNNKSTFTAKYRCFYLVYIEEFSSIEDAIAAEKYIKGKKREWKISLIKTTNPKMEDIPPSL